MRATIKIACLAALLASNTAFAQEAEAEGSAEGSASASYGTAELESSSAEPASGPRDFARAGTFAVGVERLFGFAKTTGRVVIDEGSVKTERDLENTSFYFLGGNSQSETESFAGPYVVPRLGLDYFVVDRVSVGAAFTYASDSGKFDQTVGGQNRNQYDVSQTSILITPRVGYAYMFSEVAGIWPRVGVSYANVKSVYDDGQDKQERTQNMFALGVEALLVILPVSHAGFTVGPTVDFPLYGKGKEPEQVGGQVVSRDRDTMKVTTLGLQFGALMWF